MRWNFFKYIVNKEGVPVRMLPQDYDIATVEQEVYRQLSVQP